MSMISGFSTALTVVLVGGATCAIGLAGRLPAQGRT